MEWRRIRQDYHTIEVCGATLPYLGIQQCIDSTTPAISLCDEELSDFYLCSVENTRECHNQEILAGASCQGVNDSNIHVLSGTIPSQDKKYTIIIDVKGETKPFIRPQQYGNTHVNHFEHNASVTISEEV